MELREDTLEAKQQHIRFERQYSGGLLSSRMLRSMRELVMYVSVQGNFPGGMRCRCTQ